MRSRLGKRVRWAAIATRQIGDEDAGRLLVAIAARRCPGRAVGGLQCNPRHFPPYKAQRAPERTDRLNRTSRARVITVNHRFKMFENMCRNSLVPTRPIVLTEDYRHVERARYYALLSIG